MRTVTEAEPHIKARDHSSGFHQKHKPGNNYHRGTTCCLC